MPVETLAYKMVADTRKFTRGTTVARKELREVKKTIEQTRTPLEK